MTVAFVILDGWGIGESISSNAVFAAHTPNFDRIRAQYPGGALKAHGEAVGLPDGQMGNSEVGHTTIGAGRVVWMDLPKIDKDIQSGAFFTQSVLQEAIKTLKATGGTWHIIGLVSNGGVHSHERHMLALAKLAHEHEIPTRLHIITDGRDVSPHSAFHELPKFLEALPSSAKIGTVMGRFYAMDRDQRWERVQAAYEGIVQAKGRTANSAMEAVRMAYDAGESDEFIAPTVMADYDGVHNQDGFAFANFRSDRARELTEALASPKFEGFMRDLPMWSSALSMVSYSEAHNAYISPIYQKDSIKMGLGEVVAKAGLTQLRLAETEKYPHVTFFFNGGEEAPHQGETRYMAASPKVRTYDLKPEMSAAEVGEALEKAILSNAYDLIVCNFANPDMVGHTGDLQAAIQAVEAVDIELGKAINAIENTQGKMIVTADHGNCEVMIDPISGEPHTAHTLNPVAYTILGGDGEVCQNGGLADLAPTLLKMLNIEKPDEMTGQCLIR